MDRQTSSTGIGISIMDMVSILQQVDLFRGLDGAQLAQISSISSQLIFNEGDTVCRQGDEADSLYIVSRGQASVIVHQADGSRDLMVYLGRGQIIGEMTLVDAGRRSASVMAVEDNTLVVSIPNADFTRLCEANTAIGYLIMRNIAQDLSFKLRHQDSKILGRNNGGM
jgi:CRP/FNR family transcriptional regulator, cyclic AMP receptor protein